MLDTRNLDTLEREGVIGRAHVGHGPGLFAPRCRRPDAIACCERCGERRVMGRDEDSYRSEVIELLQWVGLGDRLWALPPVLSGGEKQRAAIARAVIARPELLLADEPTGNVDPAIGNRLLRLFVELNRLGTSVIIATHDYALMEQLDAPRLVLYDGHLQMR